MLINFQTSEQNIRTSSPLIIGSRITLTSGWSRGTCGGFVGSLSFYRVVDVAHTAVQRLLRRDANAIDTRIEAFQPRGGQPSAR